MPLLSEIASGTTFQRSDFGDIIQKDGDTIDYWFSKPPITNKSELFNVYHKPEDFQMTPLKKYENESPTNKSQKKTKKCISKENLHSKDISFHGKGEFTYTSKHYADQENHSNILGMLDDRKFNHKHIISNRYNVKNENNMQFHSSKEHDEEKDNTAKKTEVYV